MSVSDKLVYMVVWFTVKNLEEFINRYAVDVVGQLHKAGTELLAAGAPEPLEGKIESNRAVIVKFPNREVADAWYGSPEYLPFKKLRLEELTSNGSGMIIEEFDPSTIG